MNMVKRILLPSLMGLMLLTLSVQTTQARTTSFAKGADVSWVDQEEASGLVFRDAAGRTEDLFALLQHAGVNAVRLRVWVNPADGWCDGADVLYKARRAAALGMRIMIDFHYSDSWADPGKQTTPSAWAHDDLSKLVTDVYGHTHGILSYLKANGIHVSWVQVGNEINNGMLWPIGKTPHFSALAQLINSGYKATKAVFPNAKVIVHLANGYDNANFRWFFDHLKAAGGHWDVVGMSLYPSTSNWKTYNNKIAANMRDMVARYGSDVVVSEVGMNWRQAATAKAMLSDLISKTRSIGAHGLGIFYWEPDGYPDWNGYDMGAVNGKGQFTQAMDAFH